MRYPAAVPLRRDPLSEWFDRSAVAYLRRAYDHYGEWTGLYLPQPSVDQRAAAALIGIWSLGERDKWGEVRWVRAFKRSVYWHHKRYGYSGDFRPGQARASDQPGTALEWQTGQLVYKAGWPQRRWAIRIRVLPGGAAAAAAVADTVPASKRWIGPAGRATALQSTPADRDWEP